jgi:hypothetical protein
MYNITTLKQASMICDKTEDLFIPHLDEAYSTL